MVVFALDPDVRRWIEHELFGEPVTAQFVASCADLIRALSAVGPTKPGALVFDLAALKPDEMESILAMREQGWAGVVIAIGPSTSEAQRSFDLDCVIEPFVREGLRKALREAGEGRPTSRIRAIRPD